MKPFTNRGACTPVQHDHGHLIVHTCCRPRGGDKTIQPPIYSLVVHNDENITGLRYLLSISPGAPEDLPGDVHIETGSIQPGDSFNLWINDFDSDGNDNSNRFFDAVSGNRILFQFADGAFIISQISSDFNPGVPNVSGFHMVCTTTSNVEFVAGTQCFILLSTS